MVWSPKSLVAHFFLTDKKKTFFSVLGGFTPLLVVRPLKNTFVRLPLVSLMEKSNNWHIFFL